MASGALVLAWESTRQGHGKACLCPALEGLAVLGKPQGRFGDTLRGSGSPAQGDT